MIGEKYSTCLPFLFFSIKLSVNRPNLTAASLSTFREIKAATPLLLPMLLLHVSTTAALILLFR